MQARNRPSCSVSSAPSAPASKAVANRISRSTASLDAIQKRQYSSTIHRPLALCLLLILLGLCNSGCYYSHLASGQLKLLWLRQPLEEATEDPVHSEQTRELLRLVDSVRQYAVELGLRVDGQYTSYVDWPGDRIVTTLVRTRPGSLEAVPHWFPIVGELPYKGYFDQDRAEAEAERLRTKEGYDVCVSAITAYSTLGWLDDPVTSPMLDRGPASLVETLFHEWVHTTAFFPSEADFNESVAQFIGQQASIRFFEDISPNTTLRLPDASRVRDAIHDRQEIAAVTQDFRDRLIEIEEADDRILLRTLAEERVREELAALPLRVLDPEAVAEGARLSNACLALRGTYVQDLPRHAQVLAALDGNLEAMIARLAEWADTNRPTEDFFRFDSSDEY
jgi:predicted aminopeptidase